MKNFFQTTCLFFLLLGIGLFGFAEKSLAQEDFSQKCDCIVQVSGGNASCGPEVTHTVNFTGPSIDVTAVVQSFIAQCIPKENPDWALITRDYNGPTAVPLNQKNCEETRTEVTYTIPAGRGPCEVNNVAEQAPGIALCDYPQRTFSITVEQCNFSGALSASPKQNITAVAQQLNIISAKSLPQLIGQILGVLMGIIGSIALVIIIAAGIIWMTAAGNSSREKTAMDMLFWGALGIIVILASYAIVQLIFTDLF